jgi:aspartate/methionine/tyrosine aminotransferase
LRDHIAPRVQVFTESVIREMTRLCQQHNGINLAQGFPDFPAPLALKEAACRAVMADVNQYAITWGTPGLRKAIADKARTFNHIPDVDADRHVTVTCGATEAMMAVMLSVVSPGDEVVLFEPFYENYGPDAALSQATLRFVPLEGRDFAIDPVKLRAAFNAKTRAIIINTPHNPTGKVMTREEMTWVAELCQEFDALAITDEIYEHMIYPTSAGAGEHISMASLPGMADRTVTISGLSKTFAVTGWRLGYAIANETLTKAIRKTHDFLTVGAPAPLQEAAITAMAFGPEYYVELEEKYRERRALMHHILSEAGLDPVMPQGAYYMMADITKYGLSEIDFVTRMIERVGVAAVPGSAFFRKAAEGGDDKARTRWVRFAFPKKAETLEAARVRLQKLPEAFASSPV